MHRTVLFILILILSGCTTLSHQGRLVKVYYDKSQLPSDAVFVKDIQSRKNKENIYGHRLGHVTKDNCVDALRSRAAYWEGNIILITKLEDFQDYWSNTLHWGEAKVFRSSSVGKIPQRFRVADKTLPGQNRNNAPGVVSGQKQRLAVLDFNSQGTSRYEAQVITELLRTEMINSGHFIIVERSEMSKIFKEQAFSMSGCVDKECAVKAGRLLSARKILVGKIMRWNKSYIINGRIVDVEKGVAEYAHKEIIKKHDDLPQGIGDFATGILNNIR